MQNAASKALATERLRITATPLHGEALIDQLCAALVDVWTTLGFRFGLARLHQTNEILVGTMLEPTPPDPLACCDASLPGRS